MSTSFYFTKSGLRNFLFVNAQMGKRHDFIIPALIEEKWDFIR